MLSANGKIRSGYVLAFLMLLVSYFLVFHTISKLNKESDMLTNNLMLMNNLSSLRSVITEAESGFRGYVLTSDTRFLKPYHAAKKEIPFYTNSLKELSVIHSIQRDQIDTLSILLDKRITLMTEGINRLQSDNNIITPRVKEIPLIAKVIMDSIYLFVNKLERSEERLGHQRRLSLIRSFNSTQTITIISLITAILAIIYSVFIYNHEKKAREKADRRVKQYSKELESHINELQKTNNELQELKSLEKFTATGRIARTIAHEVRNPLTNIFLATDQLKESGILSEDNNVLFGMVERNAGRINQLVSDLLNATKFTNLEFKKTDISELIEETLILAMDRIELNNIRVEKYYAEDLCDVVVDKEKLKLALLNIIVNAIEAMEKHKGILKIKTKKEGSRCIIEIMDNGAGMDEETQQKLFDPYFTSKSNGNGLGLTNTQSIILSHKGHIKVYSKLGEGTRFLIVLNISGIDKEK